MILEHDLTPEQRRGSQRNINAFSAVNGLSYLCVGETVISQIGPGPRKNEEKKKRA